MVGCSYHGCDLPCEPCEQHQDRVWAHTAAVQRNPSNYQQRLQAGKWRPQSSSRTSGTLDTLPHLLRSVTSLPVTAVVRQRVRLRIRPRMLVWGWFLLRGKCCGHKMETDDRSHQIGGELGVQCRTPAEFTFPEYFSL